MKECFNSVVQNNNNKTLWMSPSGFIKELVFEFVSYLLGCFFFYFSPAAIGDQNEVQFMNRNRAYVEKKSVTGSEYLQEKNKMVSAPRKSKESCFMNLFCFTKL